MRKRSWESTMIGWVARVIEASIKACTFVFTLALTRTTETRQQDKNTKQQDYKYYEN